VLEADDSGNRQQRDRHDKECQIGSAARDQRPHRRNTEGKASYGDRRRLTTKSPNDFPHRLSLGDFGVSGKAAFRSRPALD
jgi:hypothetical protein